MSKLAREAFNTLPAPDGTALGNLRHVVAAFVDSDPNALVVRATGNVYPENHPGTVTTAGGCGLHRPDSWRSAGTAEATRWESVRDMSTDLARVEIPEPLALATTSPSAEDIRDAMERLGREDPEVGHGLEDDFVRAVIAAIAEGHADPQGLAQAAQVVLSAEYPLWCG